MSRESYLNHPTFGLLYQVCEVNANQELFATLYAQRLFFLVTATPEGLQFDPIGRSDARILLEHRLRSLRRSGSEPEYTALHLVYKQTFL
ncbi:MAG: PipX family protein [Cyanobacteria bacterium J069]|nr:MAG: DUF3539 family protein [Cyanobacteria bacterium J069]